MIRDHFKSSDPTEHLTSGGVGPYIESFVTRAATSARSRAGLVARACKRPKSTCARIQRRNSKQLTAFFHPHCGAVAFRLLTGSSRH